jgi:hypothetical protein
MAKRYLYLVVNVQKTDGRVFWRDYGLSKISVISSWRLAIAFRFPMSMCLYKILKSISLKETNWKI